MSHVHRAPAGDDLRLRIIPIASVLSGNSTRSVGCASAFYLSCTFFLTLFIVNIIPLCSDFKMPYLIDESL